MKSYTLNGVRYMSGAELTPGMKEEAKKRYLHRYTGDWKPAWTSKRMPNGKRYPLQFANDVEWLENTCFAIKSDHTFDERVKHCHSAPTWPNNPDLRKGGQA